MSTPTTTDVLPVVVGRLVRPAYRAPVHAPVQSEADLLREDLGAAMDEVEQLRARLKKAQAAFAGATARLNRQSEIIARLREVVTDLRGGISTTSARAEPAERQRFEVGRLALDLTRQALLIAGQELPLSPGQARLLTCLFAQPGTVHPIGELARLMGGNRYSIRSYISRVRVQLRKIGCDQYLRSRGLKGCGGYWIADPEQSGGPS